MTNIGHSKEGKSIWSNSEPYKIMDKPPHIIAELHFKESSAFIVINTKINLQFKM